MIENYLFEIGSKLVWVFIIPGVDVGVKWSYVVHVDSIEGYGDDIVVHSSEFYVTFL